MNKIFFSRTCLFYPVVIYGKNNLCNVGTVYEIILLYILLRFIFENLSSAIWNIMNWVGKSNLYILIMYMVFARAIVAFIGQFLD